MAARTGPRPAKDRLAAARMAAETSLGIHRVHLKVCSDCYRAGADTARLCDTGWQQIKQVTRTRNRVRRIEDEISTAGLQGTLW